MRVKLSPAPAAAENLSCPENPPRVEEVEKLQLHN